MVSPVTGSESTDTSGGDMECHSVLLKVSLLPDIYVGGPVVLLSFGLCH